MAKNESAPRKKHDIAPLYLEVICNQYPEAQRVLIRIIAMCRYKVHTGFALSADDYKEIMEISVLSEALDRITSQAANLYSLNKAITDLTDANTEAEELAEKLNLDLTEDGKIDVTQYKACLDNALEAHKRATEVFKQTIKDIDQWISENIEQFKTYEQNLADNVLSYLQQPLDDDDAKAMIEAKFPEAEDKEQRIAALKKSYEDWREKSMKIFSLPLKERRVALAQVLAGTQLT